MDSANKDLPTQKKEDNSTFFFAHSHAITPTTRISIRIKAGIDPHTNRPQYSHLMGHITSLEDGIIHFRRDSAANGSHGEENYIFKKEEILALKIIPERKYTSINPHKPDNKKE